MRSLILGLAFAFLAVPVLAEDAPKKDQIEALQPVPRENGWWTTRHTQKLEEIKAADQINLVFIGDSITHGWERGSDAIKAMWEKNFAPHGALNLGYSGDRTEHVLWRFENGEIDGYKPKVAVIMIGTNNTGHRQEKPEHTAAGVKAIVEKLHQKHPETKILLLAIFPRGATPEDELRKLNTAANELIEQHVKDKNYVTFLSINDKFLEEDGTLPKSIMPDLLHPKEEGYKIWAEAITPKVNELLAK